MRFIIYKLNLITLLLLYLISPLGAQAMPLPSETSDLFLVCRGYPHWPHYKNVDEDNVIVVNYQTNKVYWYGDLTNKLLFNELNIIDEKRERTFFGGTKEIIDTALVVPDQEIKRIGRITKLSSHDYIAVTIGDYSFRARCVFYSPAEYNNVIQPHFINKR